MLLVGSRKFANFARRKLLNAKNCSTMNKVKITNEPVGMVWEE